MPPEQCRSHSQRHAFATARIPQLCRVFRVIHTVDNTVFWACCAAYGGIIFSQSLCCLCVLSIIHNKPHNSAFAYVFNAPHRLLKNTEAISMRAPPHYPMIIAESLCQNYPTHPPNPPPLPPLALNRNGV